MTPDLWTLDALIKLIQGVGFPVAVAGFVLIRLDRSLQALSKSVNDLLATLKSKS